MKARIIAPVLALLPFVFYGSFLTHKINLVTADLGRHIRNGEFLFRDAAVLTTNFYSYTAQNYATLNHHWGSGLIFYLLDRAGGIALVHLFFIVISLAAFGIYFWLGIKGGKLGWASLSALPMIFLLAERTEIRPEVFSYFFAGLFLFLLYKFRENQASFKTLLILPLLQIIWTNTHIFFALGPIIVGAFLLESLLVRREAFWRLAICLILVVAASVFNPFVFRGAMAPFLILKEFGYRLAENQTVLFMLERSSDPVLRIFPFVFLVVLLGFIPAIYKLRRAYPVVNLLLFAGFSFLAWFQIRNIAFFGLAVLPILAYNLRTTFGMISELRTQKAGLAITAIVLVIAASGNLLHYFPYWREFGIGTEPGNKSAVEFFREQKIAGPIFNNYDIGGFLIYHLFPQERVFVDNRPEAYGRNFFQSEYIPMQQDDEKWKAAEERYKFNSIIFSHRDATPWGQKFLSQRVQDPSWAAVYFDEYVIIMLKRNEQNASIIKTHEKIINNRSRV